MSFEENYWERSEKIAIDIKNYGTIIGKQGQRITDIRSRSGAKIRIDDNDGCTVSGTFAQIEKAKELIQEAINEKREKNKRKSQGRAFSGTGNNASSRFGWENVDILPSTLYGKFIGKQGINIKRYKDTYNVELKIDKDSNQLMIKGERQEKCEALQGIQDFVTSKQKADAARPQFTKNVEVISDFKKEYLGAIIGKNGSNLKRLRENYCLQIAVDGESGKISIEGDDENKQKFKVHLRNIVMSVTGRKERFGMKREFPVGLLKIEQIELKQSPYYPSLRSLHTLREISTERSYNNIFGLKETMLKAFEQVHEAITENPEVICNVMLHTGKVYSKEVAGNWKIDHVFAYPNDKHLVYRKLTPRDLTFDEFEDISNSETYRYDITIYTPEPIRKYRYKIFAKFNETKDKMEFITPEKAGERGQEFSHIRAGPGYFSLDPIRVGRFDIVDFSSVLSLRLNIQYGVANDGYEEDLKHHIIHLKDPFLSKIQIIKDKNDYWNVEFPSLPDGYLLVFFRSALRKSYNFANHKVMQTSVELIHVDRDNPRDSQAGEEIMDVFFVCNIVNKMLDGNDWDPQQIVNEFENTLSFSDIITPHLL